MENLTPMFQQYQTIKKQYKDCVLFFRLGDFYEMFYEDAREASRILNLVLTSRGSGKTGKVPMCGIPYHSADNYISKLIKSGLKVAICEQVQDPTLAKGIVKRDVTRVITTGTFIDESVPEARYLLSLNFDRKTTGVAFIDISSGTIQTNQYDNKNKLVEAISKLPVYECLFPANQEETVRELFQHPLLKYKPVVFSPYQDWCFNPEIAKKSLCEHFQTHNLRGFGVDDMPMVISASGALLEYLKAMNNSPLLHVDKISLYADSEYVFISPAACLGLELEGLIKATDKTLSPLGKRKLKDWLYHPLKDVSKIMERQNAVTLLKNETSVQQELTGLLRNIPDIDKSLSRISCGYTHARDLLALRFVILKVPEIKKATQEIAGKNKLFVIEDLPEMKKLLEEAVNPEVPLSHPEGKIIKEGFHEELDSLRNIQETGKQWLKNLQAEQIKRTGINSLKIGYNKVFGYYIEVTKANLNLVPQDYIRKQTLVNAERFIIPELKEFEEKMLTAEEKVLKIESEILHQLQKQILDKSPALHQLSSSLAQLDVINSMSLLACSQGYIAPCVTEDEKIVITEGRHPVVEHSTPDPFVPNDILLDCQENHLLIITGPNMAGKSTYIRQNALLVIMAQMGSYIPAKNATIGIVDKIFTRIGAHDEISKGQSTFMVEMSETAGILNNLSNRSLVILDEIGRGTSTFDGLSLAWAVAEYLQKFKARTLFATHFHELTALADQYAGVKNYNVAVKEWGEEVVFLHKIIPGGTDDSYGIYVAKLAGIPQEVIQRSGQILTQLELHGNLKENICKPASGEVQLSLFSLQNDPSLEEIRNEIKSMNIDTLTPVEALQKIAEWKKKVENKNKRS